MPQSDELLPWKRAVDNAALALRFAGVGRGEARERASALLGRLGLGEFERARPRELSGGMRQRVAFARTLLAGRGVLLLDEPFAALDAITRADLQVWLRETLASERRTTLLVTHDVEEALYLGDRVLVLSPRPGRVVWETPAPPSRTGDDRAAEVSAPQFVELRHLAQERLAEAMRSMRGRILGVLAPIALIAVLIGAWQIAADTGALADLLDLDSFFVPAPSEIATALGDNRELLLDNAWVTLQEVLLGFGIALSLGVALAAALHLSPLLRRAIYPLAVGSQTIPILVVAPIFVIWFGFGIGPKVAIVALICFFPIVVNTLDGLASTSAQSRKLMRSLGAGPVRSFTTLELPAALPYLFSGAKIAVAVAVIGAVFGEWAGADSGLGHLILIDNAQVGDVDRLFASVVVLSAMAMALFAVLAAIERLACSSRWKADR